MKLKKDVRSIFPKPNPQPVNFFEPAGPNPYSTWSKPFLIIMGIFLGIIGLSFSVTLLYESKLPAQNLPPEVAIEKQPEEWAREMAMDMVLRQLKVPLTAEFDYSSLRKTDLGNNAWRIGGKVDSQNSFGAMLRTSWNVELQAKPNCNDYRKHRCWTVQSELVFW